MDKLNNETKTLVLVNDISNAKKLKKYLKTNRKYTVVALATEDQKKLEKENIYCKTPSDYLTDKVLEEIEQNTRLWIKTWPKTKINGKSFIELVSYSDTSLWWFIEGTLYSSVKALIMDIELVKHIIDKEKANEILIFGNGPLEEILHTFSGVEVKKIKEKRLTIKLNLNLKYFAKNYPNLLWNFSRIYDLLKMTVAKIMASNGHSLNHEFKRMILIYSHNLSWRVAYDPMTKQSRPYDYFFDSIIQKLEKMGYKSMTTFPVGYLTTNPCSSFISGLKAIIERRKYGMIHKPFEYYLTIGIDKKANIQRKKLLKIWNELKNNERFKNSTNYKGVNLCSLLKSDFLFFFLFAAGYAVKNIETASRMMDIERPILFLTHGGGDYFCELSLITQSKRNNIPILEIQHGIISRNSIRYRHPKGWISYKMAVYGPHYKDILTQANEFPLDSVVVTGQPRYDILNKASRLYEKKLTFNKLNLNMSKKLIVWTTNSQAFTEEGNRELFRCVFRSVKKLSHKIQLVIKLHPTEFDISLHKKIAKEVGITPIIIKDIDIYELLYTCDLLITEISTTGIEAAILDKPIIILHLAGLSDPVGYVKEGVALSAYSERDLIGNIEKLLYDEEIQDELRKAREKFVYKYAYIQHGKASERVANLIIQMMEESKRKKE